MSTAASAVNFDFHQENAQDEVMSLSKIFNVFSRAVLAFSMVLSFSAIGFTQEAPKSKASEADSKNEKAPQKLTASGTPGVRFFGICVDQTGAERKEIFGTVPAEIELTFEAKKCEISTDEKAQKGRVQFKVFNNRRLITQSSVDAPFAGFSIVIPF